MREEWKWRISLNMSMGIIKNTIFHPVNTTFFNLTNASLCRYEALLYLSLSLILFSHSSVSCSISWQVWMIRRKNANDLYWNPGESPTIRLDIRLMFFVRFEIEPNDSCMGIKKYHQLEWSLFTLEKFICTMKRSRKDINSERGNYVHF